MNHPDNQRNDLISAQPGPLVLLADSQLLFTPEQGRRLLQRLREQISNSANNGFAVYIGASNNNEPAFYEMACQALAPLGVTRTLFLRESVADLGERAALVPAVILLAGGDPAAGWQLIGREPVRNWLLGCRQQGSLLLGISAGAIHLTSGITGVGEKAAPVPFLDLYPVVTLVHEEQDNWPGYICYQEYCRAAAPGKQRGCLKIPFGAGVWIEQDLVTGFGRRHPELINADNLNPGNL